MFEKTSEELWKKYAIIGIDIDINTRESIDTFPITYWKLEKKNQAGAWGCRVESEQLTCVDEVSYVSHR